MKVVVFTLDGDRLPFEGVTDVFLTNNESYKDPAGLKDGSRGKVLLLNTNGYAAALFEK